MSLAERNRSDPAAASGRSPPAQPDVPFVELDSVQKTYDGVSLVVRDLSLRIRKGEFFTMLGPSGSGKTTSLMMLAGFEHPSAGDIRLHGRSIRLLPPHKRGIGVVFQNYALFPHMTVEENVGFSLKVRRVAAGEIRERVAESLALVKLEGLGARRIQQLSGGQQQRVALARALVFRPELVLMDEPLGALDKQLREHLQLEIKQIQSEVGVTIIYVTHDQGEALTMSDRIAVFEKGEVQQIASPSELYERPQNDFVAQFIGENNRLRGKLVELADGRCKVQLDDGVIVDATPVNLTAVGAPIWLSIRPERVAIAGIDATAVNRLDARVETIIYHGGQFRVRLRLAGGGELYARVANLGRPLDLAEGEDVNVGWSLENCRAFNAE